MNLIEYYTKKRDEYESAYKAAMDAAVTDEDVAHATGLYREFEQYSKMAVAKK